MDKKTFMKSFSHASSRDWQNWRWQMQNRITKIPRLEKLLHLPRAVADNARRVLETYPMAVTPYYLSLAEACDNDPILAQCLPDIREVTETPQANDDPLGEDAFMPVPMLIHRYPDRALAIVTHTCATCCRHCNRKRFWKTKPAGGLKKRIDTMARYVAQTPQIREVILSGGDPLTYDDDTLAYMLSAFAAIDHVEILRIGSRAPAVMPMRITGALCRLLGRFRPLWFNTQFNHPREITPEAARACQRLLEAGIPVSNQSVLLAGVNDTPEVMHPLLQGLQKISVRPYYLFHCEPVRGCTHFRTTLSSGIALLDQMRQTCSGLALPQYVADLPGRAGKVPLLALSDSVQKNLKKHQDFFDFLK